jgi:hypothetical protein
MEGTPPNMELVLIPEDALCRLCNKHVGPFMVEVEAPQPFGPFYICQFCRVTC